MGVVARGLLRAAALVALAGAVLATASGCGSAGAYAPAAPSADVLRPGLRTGELFVGGYLRTWTVYVPPGVRRDARVPLVVVLHGSGSDGNDSLNRNGWTTEADRRSFIVVAPDGLPARPRKTVDPTRNPRLWNDGHLVGAPERETVDDVAFITAMLDRVAADLPVDAARTFMAGHSNGGGMAFRVAAGASERFAAIAVVASHVWTGERPSRPMRTLYIVGTRDPLLPLAGGRADSPYARPLRPPVAVTVRRWADALGIGPGVPRVVRDDAGERMERYGDADAVKLDVCFVKGQGHGWPGGARSSLPETTMGPSVATVDATRLIWDYFAGTEAR